MSTTGPATEKSSRYRGAGGTLALAAVATASSDQLSQELTRHRKAAARVCRRKNAESTVVPSTYRTVYMDDSTGTCPVNRRGWEGGEAEGEMLT